MNFLIEEKVTFDIKMTKFREEKKRARIRFTKNLHARLWNSQNLGYFHANYAIFSYTIPSKGEKPITKQWMIFDYRQNSEYKKDNLFIDIS